MGVIAAASKIVLHHVGGRWLNQPLSIPPRFAEDFVSILHEADADAIPAMRAAASGNVVIVPSCLADRDVDATLHIYPNPGFTSLRPLGRLLSERYKYDSNAGLDLDHGANIGAEVERRPVRCTTLDRLLAVPIPPCPPPDFITLDVQSLEYEVLLGAEEQLRKSVCGVIAEVEFGEMYAGQRRFQDVFDLLSGFGFEFVRFLTIGENGGPEAPLGFRADGYQVWADALFLRRPGSFDADSPAGQSSLAKLCFLAISLGNVELAVACVERLPRTEPGAFPSGSYEEFVSALGAMYARSEKLWPPRLSQVLPAHRFRDFAAAPGPEQWLHCFEGLRELGDDFITGVRAMLRRDDTEFEALLRRHDFSELADRVNELRQHQAYHVLRVIEITKRPA